MAPPPGSPGATTDAARPHERRVRQTSLPRHSRGRSTERPFRCVAVDHTVRPSPAVPSREGTPARHDQHQCPARNPPSALGRSLCRPVRERRSATDNRLTKLGGPFSRGHRGPFQVAISKQVEQCLGRAGDSASDAPEIIYCTAVADPVGLLPEPAAGRADAKAVRHGKPTAARKR